jgi:hypothetical protein
MTKQTFIEQTGHGKGLAETELLSVFPNSIVEEVYDGWAFEADEFDPIATMNKMGGAVRLLKVLQKGPAVMPLNFEEWVVKAITNHHNGASGKFRFGLNMHPKSDKILKGLLIGSKKKLKELGNVRFVNKDFQNLSSVQAWHEDLLGERAIELTLFKGDKHWYLAQTVAIQDFEWYSHRDYERPSPDASNGMFPPKLAQILINLASQDPSETIFDPFCGSGTVLQEAVLMGFKAFGSDISEKMVMDSQENLRWLQDQVERSLDTPTFLMADATKLTKKELPKQPFVVVTETWLGPALKQVLSPLERPKVHREIESLYDAFFSNLRKQIEAPLTVVFTAPYHRENHERLFLHNLPAILKKHAEIVPLSKHERPSLFFERKQQLVSREIWKIILHPSK